MKRGYLSLPGAAIFTIAPLLVIVFFSGCAGMWGGSNTPVGKLPLPDGERLEPSHSLRDLRTVIEQLNPIIGTYPPTFTSPEEKEQLYETWTDAYLDLQYYLKTQGETESILWTAAELARQGHNMDVHQTGLLASDMVERCLEKFPKSVICHFSAADYYTSIRVTRDSVSRMRRSLEFLRKNFAPKVNQNVEEKFVQLHLYEGDTDAAKQQIKKCLKFFPKSKNRSKLVKLQQDLNNQAG